MSSTAPRTRTTPLVGAARPIGRLEWRRLLDWLREDGLVDAAAAERVARRYAAGDSSLPALVRLGGAGLQHAGRPRDTEALTEWLARRAQLPYLRIDPLKVDVGRVAEVMSAQYAELRKVLPVTITPEQVTVATSEPFDTGWVAEIESHSRRKVRLVVANPEDIARFT
ncbi:MAG: type II secretion system protein E, partial [Burkholderiales bacterium PBB5]